MVSPAVLPRLRVLLQDLGLAEEERDDAAALIREQEASWEDSEAAFQFDREARVRGFGELVYAIQEELCATDAELHLAQAVCIRLQRVLLDGDQVQAVRRVERRRYDLSLETQIGEKEALLVALADATSDFERRRVAAENHALDREQELRELENVASLSSTRDRLKKEVAELEKQRTAATAVVTQARERESKFQRGTTRSRLTIAPSGMSPRMTIQPGKSRGSHGREGSMGKSPRRG